MNISGLTDNEIKAVMLVHKKKGSLNKEKAGELYAVAENNKLFSTREGLKYLKRLNDFAHDNISEDDKGACVFCDWPIDIEGAFICQECIDILEKRYADIIR